MTDRPGWVHKVTQAFARSPQPATQLDERHVRLRTFQRQLRQLRDMAETAHNSLTASYYESVWREMGEELAFLTRDIDTGQLAADDMTAAFEEWQTKGRAHLRHHPEAVQIFQLIDLGGGATLQLPSDRHADAQAARTNANDEALARRLDDLMGRAEQAEFDAERLDHADRPQAAEQLRENPVSAASTPTPMTTADSTPRTATPTPTTATMLTHLLTMSTTTGGRARRSCSRRPWTRPTSTTWQPAASTPEPNSRTPTTGWVNH
ncbi:hypothetical protein [Kribbella sp. NPDC023855]|uniref:hypothetical protein n=1 Tax=Kribbella sp. NPDC023855 TaxID=3154698 RepID=UPI0033EDA105